MDLASDWCAEEGVGVLLHPVPNRVAPRRSLQKQVPCSGASSGVWTYPGPQPESMTVASCPLAFLPPPPSPLAPVLN